MSRLDSAIRRLKAQRTCLDWACSQIKDSNGLVLELGLGNGRTYDHLRAQLPGRPIHVFDRALACHPDSEPEPKHFNCGELSDTLPLFLKRQKTRVDLAHLDIGAGTAAQTRANLNGVARSLCNAMAPDGLVLSDQPLLEIQTAATFTIMSLPDGVLTGRYFIYKASGVR